MRKLPCVWHRGQPKCVQPHCFLGPSQSNSLCRLATASTEALRLARNEITTLKSRISTLENQIGSGSSSSSHINNCAPINTWLPSPPLENNTGVSYWQGGYRGPAQVGSVGDLMHSSPERSVHEGNDYVRTRRGDTGGSILDNSMGVFLLSSPEMDVDMSLNPSTPEDNNLEPYYDYRYFRPPDPPHWEQRPRLSRATHFYPTPELLYDSAQSYFPARQPAGFPSLSSFNESYQTPPDEHEAVGYSSVGNFPPSPAFYNIMQTTPTLFPNSLPTPSEVSNRQQNQSLRLNEGMDYSASDTRVDGDQSFMVQDVFNHDTKYGNQN